METIIELAELERDDELELVKQIQAGSREAFDALFQRHKAFIFNVCYRVLGSNEEAIDATQATFIQAFQNIGRFRRESRFSSWLCRIAINTAIGATRKRRNHVELTDDAMMTRPPVSSKQPDRVWEAILELPLDLRAVLVLFYFEDMNGEEAADALGCTAGAFRTKLHRARAAFKLKYEELIR